MKPNRPVPFHPSSFIPHPSKGGRAAEMDCMFRFLDTLRPSRGEEQEMPCWMGHEPDGAPRPPGIVDQVLRRLQARLESRTGETWQAQAVWTEPGPQRAAEEQTREKRVLS